jgi:hypothetical protein
MEYEHQIIQVISQKSERMTEGAMKDKPWTKNTRIGNSLFDIVLKEKNTHDKMEAT